MEFQKGARVHAREQDAKPLTSPTALTRPSGGRRTLPLRGGLQHASLHPLLLSPARYGSA
jgi:hypothetical protein